MSAEIFIAAFGTLVGVAVVIMMLTSNRRVRWFERRTDRKTAVRTRKTTVGQN